MSGNDFNTLKKIISLQYRKFIRFYRLVEDYSDDIESLEYEFNSPSSLDVSIKMTNKDLESIKDSMEKYMEEYAYDGNIEVKKKTLSVSIILEEEEEKEDEEEDAE